MYFINLSMKREFSGSPGAVVHAPPIPVLSIIRLFHPQAPAVGPSASLVEDCR